MPAGAAFGVALRIEMRRLFGPARGWRGRGVPPVASPKGEGNKKTNIAALRLSINS